MLSKKKKDVEVTILTSIKSNIEKLDIKKFNKEYPILKLEKTNKFHDRFIIVDNKEMYHLGASIKDLGKKCFGLNREAIKKIFDQGYTLMITVDCGISGIEEIDYANSLGIETIITDHHEPAESLPNAYAVIDAKRKDNKYPFNQLAGVGVVFKVIQALSIKLGLDEKEYLKYLDIVCVGTISDIVPLVDENRVIAKL